MDRATWSSAPNRLVSRVIPSDSIALSKPYRIAWRQHRRDGCHGVGKKVCKSGQRTAGRTDRQRNTSSQPYTWRRDAAWPRATSCCRRPFVSLRKVQSRGQRSLVISVAARLSGSSGDEIQVASEAHDRRRSISGNTNAQGWTGCYPLDETSLPLSISFCNLATLYTGRRPEVMDVGSGPTV